MGNQSIIANFAYVSLVTRRGRQRAFRWQIFTHIALVFLIFGLIMSSNFRPTSLKEIVFAAFISIIQTAVTYFYIQAFFEFTPKDESKIIFYEDNVAFQEILGYKFKWWNLFLINLKPTSPSSQSILYEDIKKFYVKHIVKLENATLHVIITTQNNLLYDFEIEAKTAATNVAMQRVLKRLYQKNMSIREYDKNNENTYLLNPKSGEDVPEKYLDLIDEIGKNDTTAT